MNGKLYVIEAGSDASGKKTQTDLLYKKLVEKYNKVKKVEFPNYKSDSSFLVKMYLNGDIKEKPDDVNAYASSTFYAIDRYLTFERGLREFYENGGIIIADRYVTSNMIYQLGKLDDEEERARFIKWLYDLEYRIYNLPRPTDVFYLDTSFEVSQKLLEKRRKKLSPKDIHEENKDYLKKIYDRSLNIAKSEGWQIIDCMQDGKLLPPLEINRKILGKIKHD